MNKVVRDSSLLAVLNRKAVHPAPIWLMRQAGRYLPEYQATRKQAGSFWTMCMTPELAVEVTLQPIRRFDFDAAILFSDILVVPFALGQGVRFEDGIGPVLEVFPGFDRLVRNETVWAEKLQPVYDAMRLTRTALAPDKAMIGFAGAPWTLAAYRNPGEFTKLLNVLADMVAWHLIRQFQAGADVVQIFDSWAGGLPAREFADWVVAPNKRVVATVRRAIPDAPIIGFPRAATQTGYEAYAIETGVSAVSVDTAASMQWAVSALGSRVALQGNLDPIALIAGGEALDRAVDGILKEARETPFIFNLGHGVLPETPLAHVAQLVARVRSAA